MSRRVQRKDSKAWGGADAPAGEGVRMPGAGLWSWMTTRSRVAGWRS